MKKISLFMLIAALFFIAACSTPKAETTTAAASAANAETAAPAASDPVEAAVTADELRELIEQYQGESDYEMVYKAAMRLIELEPSDTDAYTAAMSALTAIASSSYERINELLAQGVESAQDARALTEWANNNQPDDSIELPFLPDYASKEQINTAGTNPGNLVNDVYRYFDFFEAGLFASQGDWIYFSRPDESFAIYKMRTDGSDYQRVGETYGSCINVVGDWIYFRKVEGDIKSICKMRTDGSKLTTISENSGNYLSVSGDWVYYGDENDHYRLFSVRTDGSEEMALTEGDAVFSCVYKDWVYATSGSEFYRIRIDGSETQRLKDNYVDMYSISGDRIYYLDGNSVRWMRLDGSEDEEVLRWDAPIATMNIAGDSMVLSVNNDGISGQIIIVDFNSFEVMNTFEQCTDAIYVDNVGNVYFIDYNDMTWCRIDLGNGELAVLG